MSDLPEDFPDDMIGVLKIKDGIFICDELGAQVRITPSFLALPTTFVTYAYYSTIRT